MPSNSQTRAKRGRKTRRSTTQFGEPDTQQASPPPQSQKFGSMARTTTAVSLQKPDNAPQPSRALTDEYGNDIGDEDLLQFADSGNPSAGKDSAVVRGRRSSPASNTVPESIWDLNPADLDDDEEPLPLVSSPKVENLPETVPMPRSQEIDQGVTLGVKKHSRVDLSETASTVYRSEPPRTSEARESAWDFDPHRPSSRPPREKLEQSEPVEDEDEGQNEANNDDELPPLGEISLKMSIGKTKASHSKTSRLDFESEKNFVSSPPNIKQTKRHTSKVPQAQDGQSPALVQAVKEDSPYDMEPDSRVRTRHKVAKLEPRKPLNDITSKSPNDAFQHSNDHRVDINPTPPHASESNNGSWRKRKQQAKEPLVFDPKTQAVTEGPPSKKRSPPTLKAATMVKKRSSPVPRATKTSNKRPATSRSTRPTKKPKIAEPKKAEPVPTTKKAGNRAAAKTSRAAVKEQLSSSPPSEHQEFGILGVNDDLVEPVYESPLRKAPVALVETESGPRKELQTSNSSDADQEKLSVASRTRKVPIATTRGKANGLSPKEFGGASGRMYSAAEVKAEPKMIKDSQNDTQDHNNAHLAEESAVKTRSQEKAHLAENAARNVVCISSDAPSDSGEDELPEALSPKPATGINDGLQRRDRGSDLCDEPQPQDLAIEDEEVPESMVAADFDLEPRLKRKDASIRFQQTFHNKVPVPEGDAVSATEKSRKALAPRDNNRANRGDPSGKTANEHLRDPLVPIKEKGRAPKNANSRGHSQANFRPDDAFVNSSREPPGRSRARSSGLGRTLSISRAGSPNRLSDDGNKRERSMKMSSANSEGIRENLGHEAGKHPTPAVMRRLSYEPIAPPKAKAKDRKLSERASDFEIDETTMVESQNLGTKEDVSKRPKNVTSQVQLSKIKHKIYSQMSAAHPVEEAPAPNPVEAEEPPSPMKTNRASIAIQLHAIVDLVIQRLKESETSVEHTVGAYEEGTSSCVERIEKRLDKEHKVLVNQWYVDSERFTQSVQRAAQPLESAGQDRRKTASGLERAVAQRQLLYDQASGSLRAFQHQDMRG